jgi:predicted ATPase/DNA-binding SARP family transcriptional activator
VVPKDSPKVAGVATVEFQVLGPLRVLVDGVSVRLGGPRPRALLAALLVRVGQTVSTSHLIDQVWGDAPPATAIATLQMHVSALRKVLGDRLVTASSGYLLDVASDDVDFVRFEAMVAQGRRHLGERPARAVADLSAALGLWDGEPYTDVPGGSDVVASRLRLVELRLSAIEDRLDAELALGRHARIVAELAGLVVQHPVRERLAGLYLRTLYRCGRIADAQAHYQELRLRLDEELGLEPGPDIAALARAIDRRDPTLDPPTTIPVPPSRFIGRRGALEQLAVQLGRSRLLTVTGPGGSGKTRLALELARDTEIDHPDGVYVVELASARDDGSIADRLATALSVRGRGAESLVAHLRDLRALILLDNCEHLVDGCAKLVAELLSNCVGLRILVTSREPLGVTGEHVWPLAGLAMPAATDNPAVAARAEAVRLLADRGTAARVGFVVDGDDVLLAGQLCRWLDGLPLAIELAAAQLRTMSLSELTAHIGQRLGSTLSLTDRRSRTTPERHQTMRAAIDWSYRLLSPAEQALFRRLSVFAGGCGLAAVTSIGADHDEDMHAVLARLVDQSILTVDMHGDGTRYRMLELVREYAMARLVESGEVVAVRHRHAAWCAELAAEAEDFGGPEHVARMRRLGVEEANLRAAIEWCLGEGADPVRALEIASRLWWYWWARGLMIEGRDWLLRGLAAADPAPSLLRGLSLRAAAALTRNSGDFVEARQLGEECLSVYEALADRTGVTIAYGGLCVTAIAQRDYNAGLRYARESCRLAEEDGDQRRYGSALNNIGLTLRILGRPDEATPQLEAALRVWQTLRDKRGEAAALGNLGIIARQTGDPARSRRLCLAGLANYVEADIPEGVLDVLDALACLDIAEGRPAVGLRMLTVSERERERLGAPLLIEDEITDRAAALAAAHAALGPKAAAVVESARDLPLDVIVSGLLGRR